MGRPRIHPVAAGDAVRQAASRARLKAARVRRLDVKLDDEAAAIVALVRDREALASDAAAIVWIIKASAAAPAPARRLRASRHQP